MVYLNVFILLFVIQSTAYCKTKDVVGTNLRIMTFNVWISGLYVDNGIEKIAKAIKEVNPDVVALQVCNCGDRV